MKRLLVFVFSFLFVLTAQSFAHKISAFVDVEDGNVSLVSYFSDGTPAKNAKVTVYDSKGNVVLTGRTNKEGEFDFKIKKSGKYKAVVLAELGHRAVVDFTVGTPAGSSQSGTAGNTGTETAEQKQSNSAAPPPTAAEFRKVLREELRPIHRELLKIEEAQSSISYKDVIGGLGWILGIFGAAMFGYCYRRREGGDAS